jgi:hypothetical protein
MMKSAQGTTGNLSLLPFYKDHFLSALRVKNEENVNFLLIHTFYQYILPLSVPEARNVLRSNHAS